MQLYVLILNKVECMPKLVEALLKAGIKGATIYDSMESSNMSGMTDGAPPMFGSLRKYLHPDHGNNKTLLLLLEDSQIDTVKKIVNDVTGGLSKPDVGIAFAMPVSYAEGLS